MKTKVYIDGEAGTTGLQIRSRLAGRSDLDVFSLPEAVRKNGQRRAEAINSADVVILCLPDDAAREAVSFIANPAVRVIDASSAHRVTPDWVYGFAELSPDQSRKIATARFVSNPGCYPTGALAIVKPLIACKLVPSVYPFCIHAVSGYSGAGSQMIDQYENPENSAYTKTPIIGYGLSLEHKHIKEIECHAELARRPIFLPMIGRYRQGILMYVGIHLSALPDAVSVQQVHRTLEGYYDGHQHVSVTPLGDLRAPDNLDAESMNGNDGIRLHVFGNDEYRQCVVAAVYDNLGKGASGAAVQNLDLMISGS
ncbi:N-acetyl-gamma-glutamyl-phosphate reductase [Trinickia mobilis]|uniref:N-acetyl-gamma-glutamyl-phosphate reductase n=1 Tax=Trinickia mobilis TaxID=2816356 RepID=UPI001A8D35AF|nr:N-acetyl-gamma-glutamyl-phosphate reductase [Trinickia mobilis]